MQLRFKSRERVSDPGARIVTVDLLMEGVGTDVVNGDVRVLQSGYECRKVGHGLVAIGAPGLARGQLSTVKVVQLTGDAAGFEAMLFDRFQEAEYIGNRIWASSAVIAKATEYAQGYGFPYGYPEQLYGEASEQGTAQDVTLNVIEADSIAVDYENRTSFDDDMHEIYAKVKITGASTNNEIHFKVVIVPMA